jgi:hypothetical protein
MSVAQPPDLRWWQAHGRQSGGHSASDTLAYLRWHAAYVDQQEGVYSPPLSSYVISPVIESKRWGWR